MKVIPRLRHSDRIPIFVIVTANDQFAIQALEAGAIDYLLKLRNSNFRRIHRKALVNIDHIRKMTTLSSQRWLITLSNNMEFVMSKRLARNVRQLLSW